MTEVPIIWKSAHGSAEQINGLVSIRQGPPSCKSECFATCIYSSRCINREIFLDYDKIIDVYASKYPRRMLLILIKVKNKLLKRLMLEKHIKLT